MDTAFGIVGKDFVLLAADKTLARSIFVRKMDEDKIINLSDTCAFSMSCQDQANRMNFGEYVQKNLALAKLRNGFAYSTKAIASFVRVSCPGIRCCAAVRDCRYRSYHLRNIDRPTAAASCCHTCCTN